MSYILKNTSGLVNTRITDTGRLKLSQGNFNISYFQIGDSEVSYNELPNTYNQSNSVVLEPSFNIQKNKMLNTHIMLMTIIVILMVYHLWILLLNLFIIEPH